MVQQIITPEVLIASGILPNPPKQFTVTLAPGEILPVFYNFNYVRILTLANPSDIEFRFGDSALATDVIGAGIGFELPYITDRLVIRNKNVVSPNTIVISLAIGKIYDDRLNVSGIIQASTVIPSTLTTFADVSTAAASQQLLLAANANRKEAFISNPATNAATFRIGDVNTGASRGAILAPGATMIITNTAAIYGYNPTAGAQSLALMESNA